MPISINERININGVSQFIAIRAEGEKLPLLLYLHGGPGDAALPLVLKYNGELAKQYTLVIWEQRGAGKSYYEFSEQENISIDTFVQDARTLIEILLERFGQEKIYLVGHSWGSVIGLLLCRQFPSLIHTYIGCGQVVNMRKSSRMAYEYALEHASGKEAERLTHIDCSYSGVNWLKDLLFVTKLVVKYKGSLYGAGNYNRLVWDFLLSKEYSIRELIYREKGALQSIRYLWQELMDISFEETISYEVPVILVEGRHDYHVSSQLAGEYFDKLTSPKKFYLFENSCHFPQWSEADKFNLVLAELLR